MFPVSICLTILMAQVPAAKAPAVKGAASVKTPVATPKTAPSVKTGVKTVAKPAVARPLAAKAPAVAPLVTDEAKTLYALGLSIYRSLGQFDLSPADLEIVQRAIRDAALKQPAVELNEWGPKLQTLGQARQARVAEREKAGSVAYLAKAATEAGAIKTDSGLILTELKAGDGPSPTAADTVKVHYRGTLVDGTEFDSSYKRNEPAQFPLGNVIPCWTEGVQKMKVGGKAKLVCPSGLAYGDSGRPSIPGGATLLFEIELLEIISTK